MRWLRFFAMLAAVGTATGCTLDADGSGSLNVRSVFAQDRTTAEFRWDGPVAPGGAVEIKGVNGAIEARLSTSGRVEVVADRRGRRDDPERVRIEVIEYGGGVTICAVYPSDDAARPNECLPGSEGRMRVKDNDVKVDFAVRVPPGVTFEGRTVNGSVEADGLESNVRLRTVNGSITFSTTGWAEATTVNGAIHGTLGRADWPDDVSFETVNGSITLALPADVNADFKAQTVNGRIRTDFPVTITGRVDLRRLSGTIGTGGRRLELSTVSGGIALERR